MLIPTVYRYMTLAPRTVSPRDTMSTAHRLMREHGFRHLPVVDDGGALVGVLSDRDLHVTHPDHADPARAAVADVMTRCVASVTPGTPLDEAIDLMSTTRCQSVVVVAPRTGAVVGILTATDALWALTDLLRRHAA